MKTAVVRTWIVCFFTLLSLVALNIDGVVSWYVNKGEGREAILRGLARLKQIHTESGIGPWLISLECAAGSAFEGSYKDKSKCRDVAPDGNAPVSWNQAAMRPAALEGIKPKETPPDVGFPGQAPAQLPGEPSLEGQVAVMLEPDGATHFQPAMELPGLVAGGDAGEQRLEKDAPPPTGDQGSGHRLAENQPPIMNAVDFHLHNVSPHESPPETVLARIDRGGADAGETAASPSQGIQLSALQGPIEVRPAAEQMPDRGLCSEDFGKADFQSVLLVGDSLAHGLALSLGRDLKDRRGAVFSFVSKVSSGLNNPNVFNWEKTMRMLIEHGAPDLVLIMMGVNDANNHIRDGSKLCAVGTPEWGQAYESRVENFLRIASENRVQVCWIGVPVVREEGLQNRVLLANMAARNACSRVENCRFIDTFEVLCDENRKYTNYLKESDGSSVRIRAKDGIHFSMEGSNLLSRHILQKLENGGTHASAQN